MLPSPAAFPILVPEPSDLSVLWFELSSASVFPGEPFDFAWLISRSSTPGWTSADLELLLVNGVDEEHLWDRMAMPWPPPLIGVSDTDGIWPPPGMAYQPVLLAASARLLIYQGLGNKTLRLRLTGHRAGAPTGAVTADQVLAIVEPTPIRLRATAPRHAWWNQPYTISGQVTSVATARLTCQIDVAASDGTAFPPVTISVPARASVTANLAGPTRQNWSWFDQPTLHVHDDQLWRTFTYTPRASQVVDEFGNAYQDTDGEPITFRVSVGESKIEAANEVEQDWWAGTATAIGSFILGLISIVAPPVAAIGAGTLAATILLANDAAQWTTVANDPPEPDDDYWASIVMPDLPVPVEPDDFAALNQLLLARLKLAHLLQAASITAGKILGARLYEATTAQVVQEQRYAGFVAEAISLAGTLPLLAQPALDLVNNNKNLAPDTIRAELVKRAKSGFTADEQQGLAALVDAEWAQQLIPYMVDPATVQALPAISDVVKSMPRTTLAAVTLALDELDQALQPNLKAAGKSGAGPSVAT